MKATSSLAVALLVLSMAACSSSAREAEEPAASEAAASEAEISFTAFLDSGFPELPQGLDIGSYEVAYAVDLSTAVPAEGDDPSVSLLDDSAADVPTAAELRTAYQTCQSAVDRPRSLADLKGGYQLYQSAYREEVAVKLGILNFGNATANKNAIVFEYRFWRVEPRNCQLRGTTIPVVWGVGVESTVHLRSAQKGAKTTSLPGLAASVELNNASVTMRMNVNGLVGTPVEAAFPGAQTFADFDVSAYGAWAVALDKIRTLMSDPAVTATPQLLITQDALAGVVSALRDP